VAALRWNCQAPRSLDLLQLVALRESFVDHYRDVDAMVFRTTLRGPFDATEFEMPLAPG
jgi:hypothetical protein